MKKFFFKLKKLLNPTTAVCAAAGLVTIVLYLLFGNPSTKGESALFLFSIFLCLTVLGVIAVYIFSDKYTGGSFAEKVSDPTYALLTNIDQPVLVCREDGHILWINKYFYRLSGNKDITGQNTSLFFAPQPALLCDGEHFSQGVSAQLGKRSFNVRGYRMKAGEKQVCITIWQDETELANWKKKYEEDAPMLAYVVIDNLDEILRFAEGNYRTVASMIDEVMQQWAKENKGVIKEYDRDKYLFVFHASALAKMVEEKFDILDRIREVRVGENNIPVTVSIGIGNVSGDLGERAAASVSAMEIALQRGGDQAVVKSEKSVDAYGGKTKTVQKKTKVRARVVATELMDMICTSDNVLIMGHKYADFDAFGACIGISHLCAVCGVDFNIVSNLKDPNLQKCFQKAHGIPTIRKDTFIDAAEAQDRLRTNTLLIIVDVNNPQQFEAPDLAANAARIVCIDHHRKTGEFAIQPKITYIEPSASSACELVSDMLEQSVPAGTLHKDEAELMLAGIVLDTKKYEINTGTKTFGAAQYLKGEGADPGNVQQLFITNFEDYRREAGFGAKVTVYKERYAISVNENSDNDPANRVAAAKAADRLLSVEGVEASFAVVQVGDATRISGRSNGKINVQLILERMGGGGRFDAAAAELKTAVLTEALNRLKQSIDGYEEELEQSELVKAPENSKD